MTDRQEVADMEVSEDEMREAAQDVVAAAVDRSTAADMQRARDYLRAVELARHWLATFATNETVRPEAPTPFRAFITGYLAAVKDRT
jgi:hypothetical protein